MRFYNRETELKTLGKACAGDYSEMVVITGRRRIGKSRLVNEFLKGTDAIKVLVVPKEEKQLAADFSESMTDKKGFRPSFNNIKEALDYFLLKSETRILFIDEFPNLLEVNPSLPHEFQRAWEQYRDSSKKVLIFSGSYVGMMDKIFTKRKAPLFGRAGHTILLQPLPLDIVWEMQRDLGILDPVEQIRNFCVLGGVPFYYELLERRGKGNVISSLFFDVDAPLREEGLNILRQEFGAAYKKYFSIIEAIGAGLVSQSEIADRLGTKQTTLSKYMASLQRDFRLVDRTVPYGQNPLRSKKGIYSIRDNLTAFWFSKVYGKSRPPTEKEVNDFVSRRFENLCRDMLTARVRHEDVVASGRWWGRLAPGPGRDRSEEREIDVVVETGKNLYLGECKWTNEKVGERELGHLKASAQALGTRKPIIWVLFSKAGFSLTRRDDLLLFDPTGMDKEIRKLG